jgi:hypothetical protein
MKAILLIFLLLTSSRGFGLCLPDSLVNHEELRKEVALLEYEARTFEDIYSNILAPENDLIIKLEALNPRVNAEIIREDKKVVISIMGGMLNHPKMTEDAFKLLLCHELGHFKGGAPFKSRGGWSSTEGQADYYTGLGCARQLGMNEYSFLEGAKILTSIFAQVTGEEPPKLDRCDERVAPRTNYGYPPVQCRLDTMLAGWKEAPRPVCWFRE